MGNKLVYDITLGLMDDIKALEYYLKTKDYERIKVKLKDMEHNYQMLLDVSRVE